MASEALCQSPEVESGEGRISNLDVLVRVNASGLRHPKSQARIPSREDDFPWSELRGCHASIAGMSCRRPNPLQYVFNRQGPRRRVVTSTVSGQRKADDQPRIPERACDMRGYLRTVEGI